MWIPDFVLKIFGRRAADKLKLEEDSKMDGTKPWYQSKGVWNGVVTFLLGAYALVGQFLGPVFHFTLPAVPVWLLTILGAMGVYTRVAADTKLTS